MPTPLHFAAQHGELEEIKRLVNGGMDVNSTDAGGNTPLKYACAEHRLDAVEFLVRLGADVHRPDARGFTPLHCAAGHNYAESLAMTRFLIERGADVNARSNELGFVPLHEATEPAIIALLIARGANPLVRNSAGQTPLEYMLEEGHEEAAAALTAAINARTPRLRSDRDLPRT